MKTQESVTTIYLVYPELYEEFYRNFLKKNEFKHLILASVLLHLTFETVITHYVRHFINYVIDGLKNGPILQFWNNTYEHEDLPKKLDFFYFAILLGNDGGKNIIKDAKDFYGRLASLRNKIVHGHEVSKKEFKDGKIEKSKLAAKLDANELEKLYNEFWLRIESLLNLFILANSILPIEIKWKEVLIKQAFIDEPINKFREIEKINK